GIGYRQYDCPKNLCKRLFIDKIYDEGDGKPVYDSKVIENSVKNKEHMTGDVGPALMVQKNYLILHGNDSE
ncbi:hypothetical protein PanWU01x14_279260, partial [Parasponia andersonii]